MSTERVTIDTLLPQKWIVYLYDKQLFKKLSTNKNYNIKTKPHREIFALDTVNDLLFFIELMREKANPAAMPERMIGNHAQLLNLDMNDYIIMREGIEPIWEDPKNSDGGTFTIKLPHALGFDLWSHMILMMCGETLSSDCYNINGMTAAYISNTYSANGRESNDTYLKIWDGLSDRTRDTFMETLSPSIIRKIDGPASIQYSLNSNKKGFKDHSIMKKLSDIPRSGFSEYRNGRGRGYNRGYRR